MSLEMLLNEFNSIVQTPEDVEKVEEAILQLAVQGRLVPQESSDESISSVLECIEAEQRRLVDEGVLRKFKKLTPVKEREAPYPIPSNWRWVRLSEVHYDFGQTKPDSPFTYIDVSSIDNVKGRIDDDLEVIQPEEAPSRARKLVGDGTVIYSTVRPYLLNVAVVDREFDPPPIVSTAFEVMHPYTTVSSRFLFYYLRSRPFIKFVETQMQGMAYPAISKSKLDRALFPLPPTEEQHRIVAKLDDLFAQTNALKASLTATAHIRANFLDSLLHYSLNGSGFDEVRKL